MRKYLHISEARKIMDSGERVSLTVYKAKNGHLIHMTDCVSLSHDRYKGTRRIKLLRSGQIRSIHDCLIVGINGYDVYL